MEGGETGGAETAWGSGERGVAAAVEGALGWMDRQAEAVKQHNEARPELLRAQLSGGEPRRRLTLQVLVHPDPAAGPGPVRPISRVNLLPPPTHLFLNNRPLN